MDQYAAKPDAPPADALPKNSTVAATSTTPLRGSRWQLFCASVMLALWVAALVAMAVYSE